MATVHRALERGIEGFERIVALKRLLPHLAEDASFIKSFVREAKLASLLNHNNIVHIYELGRVGTEYFISMEYIDGRDIRRILRHARKVTGPPPIHITVGLLLQLCEALDYAHAKVDEDGHPLGLVHRDVSPSNLLVTSEGHVKVIDFGIARAQSQQLRTQTGRVKGKLAYMAPEAISGKDLDARSDLFAAGVIAHELLTARPLFASKNEYQTLLKVQRGDIIPPSTFNQACPPELDAIVLRALARDPDDRYATAGEMRDELLAMRRRHNLQTGHRDIAQWLTWAFSVEPPSGGFAAQPSGEVSSGFDVRSARRTPAPRKEDEEAVEIAWGGGDPDPSGEGIVLDDVPDVSGKHLAADTVLAMGQQLGELGLDDDIPESQPSHGTGTGERLRAATFDEGLDDGLDDEVLDHGFDDGINDHHDDNRLDHQRAGGFDDVVESVAAMSLPLPPPPSSPARNNPMPARTSQATRLPTTPPPSGRTTAQGHTPVAARPPTIEQTSGPVEARHARSLTDLSGSDDDDVVTLPGDSMPGDATDPHLPLVRFKPPTLQPVPPATTRPAYAMPGTLGTPVLAPRSKRPSDVPIGASLIARRSPRRTWLLFGGLAAAGVAATVVTLFATRGQDTVAPVTSVDPPPQIAVAQTEGTVKFVTEPPDAQIVIVGASIHHTGSPWQLRLPAGNHQIQIQRDGYKAWLTALELSANETQTLRVVLEPLTNQAVATAEATLILSSTPLGLEVVLDGKSLGRTPTKIPIKPGPHTVALHQQGIEVWRHELVAQAAVDYEFSPSMAEDKQRERAARVAPVAVSPSGAVAPDAQPVRPAPTTPQATPPSTPPATPPPTTEPPQLATTPPSTDKTVDRPAAPAPAPAPAKPVASTPAPTAITKPAPAMSPSASIATTRAAPVAAPRQAGPVVVPPSAVTKLSGLTPTIGKTKRAEVPPVVAAKVCIDPTGKVSSVAMITKLERLTSVDLSHAIKTWRYAPHQVGGVAVSACFVVSFRVQ
ncbi:MAG: protein kinase [Deltaproteobacteria bacterium]|nr:protein kinase [Deltaproteobacteria bacterium]